MVKSELIANMVDRHKSFSLKEINLAARCILEQIISSLESGERVEVRGFGSFSLRYRSEKQGRNPKTGSCVFIPERHVIHFKAGKTLRRLIDR